MVVVSYSGKEINAKLVYYGAGLSGKTTNLEAIYEAVPETSRGKMVSMKTQSDRTLFFDLLPLDLGEIMGFKTRFLLYTVPGQVFYNATRKLVLKGADAIVFVADSGIGKMEENKESLANLRSNLADYGLRLEDIPRVFQYNKRDLPKVHTVEELNAELNPDGKVPVFEAIATKGAGVFETFRGVSQQLMQKVTRELHRSPQGAAAARAARNEVTAARAAEARSVAEPPRAPAAPPVDVPAGPPRPSPAPEPVGRMTEADYGRDPLVPGQAAPQHPTLRLSTDDADEAPEPELEDDAEDVELIRDEPSLVFDLHRDVSPGMSEPTPSTEASRRPPDDLQLESEPTAAVRSAAASLATAPSLGTAPGPAAFVERTLTLDAQGRAGATPAASDRSSIVVPVNLVPGETRDIILRITVAPAGRNPSN